MRSGVIFGNAAMIDGMLDRIEEELGENFHHRHRRHLKIVLPLVRIRSRMMGRC